MQSTERTSLECVVKLTNDRFVDTNLQSFFTAEDS